MDIMQTSPSIFLFELFLIVAIGWGYCRCRVPLRRYTMLRRVA